MHHDFESALDSEVISQWTQMVEAWEADRTKQNPYERQGEGLSNPLCSAFTMSNSLHSSVHSDESAT